MFGVAFGEWQWNLSSGRWALLEHVFVTRDTDNFSCQPDERACHVALQTINLLN